MFQTSTGLLLSPPEVRMCARSGSPNMTSSGEAPPGTETLTPGGTTALGSPGAVGNSAIVQTVPTGGSGPAAGTGTGAGTGSNPGTGAPPAVAATTTPTAEYDTGS